MFLHFTTRVFWHTSISQLPQRKIRDFSRSKKNRGARGLFCNRKSPRITENSPRPRINKSKMRGSNAEIVWQRARSARRRSAAPPMGVNFDCRVEPDASNQRPCTPTLAWVTVQPSPASRSCRKSKYTIVRTDLTGKLSKHIYAPDLGPKLPS